MTVVALLVNNFVKLISCAILLFKFVESQTPIIVRNCNDPAILAHISTGHTYCFHVCGYFTGMSQPGGGATVPTCDPSGACVCQCVPGQTQAILDAGICPGGTPDPDPTALPACQQTCANACIGGTGQVCEESVPIMSNGQPAIAKICSCTCPTNSCPGVTTTTTTPAPTVAPTSVSVIPLPFWKPKLYFWWKKLKLYYFSYAMFLKKLIIFYFLCVLVNIIGLEFIILLLTSQPVLMLGRYLSNSFDRIVSEVVFLLANFVLRGVS